MPRTTVQSNKSQFSSEVLKRLSIYLRNLRILRNNGQEVISSNSLAEIINASSVQIRKDLSNFGEFGKRGVGYNIESLIGKLESILGMDRKVTVAVAGVGKLGSAIILYPGFSEFNIEIGAAFDTDPSKVGTEFMGVSVEPAEDMERVIRERKIRSGIISVPHTQAQVVADRMISAGITTILNFAPVKLKSDENVFVSNMDIAVELKTLICLEQMKGNTPEGLIQGIENGNENFKYREDELS